MTRQDYRPERYAVGDDCGWDIDIGYQLPWQAKPNAPLCLPYAYLTFPTALLAGKPESAWVSLHAHGYHAVEGRDGAFAVNSGVARGRREAWNHRLVGRDRLPEELFDFYETSIFDEESEIGLMSRYGERAIVGAIPALPAVVVCPRCHISNQVNCPPPTDPS